MTQNYLFVVSHGQAVDSVYLVHTDVPAGELETALKKAEDELKRRHTHFSVDRIVYETGWYSLLKQKGYSMRSINCTTVPLSEYNGKALKEGAESTGE